MSSPVPPSPFHETRGSASNAASSKDVRGFYTASKAPPGILLEDLPSGSRTSTSAYCPAAADTGSSSTSVPHTVISLIEKIVRGAERSNSKVRTRCKGQFLLRSGHGIFSAIWFALRCVGRGLGNSVGPKAT
jgi:hypothetical protein